MAESFPCPNCIAVSNTADGCCAAHTVPRSFRSSRGERDA
jgi:hypothetical protein